MIKIFRKRAKHLCENCKTGKESYELDSCSAICPYIIHYGDDECVYYKPIKICAEKNGLLKKIISFIFRQ